MKHNIIFLFFMLILGPAIFAKQKIRVLFVLDKFPWYTRMSIVNQINALIELGYDVYIYARNKQLQCDKIEPEIIKYNLLSRTYYKKLPPNLHTYDVILCQYGGEGKRLINIKNALNIKAKIATCFRGGDVTSEEKIKNKSYNKLFKYGDLFLPVCQYFKNKLIQLGCDSKKIKVLYSAIDCSKFKFKERSLNPDEKVRIASVCRLSEEKAIGDSIKAVARLIAKNKNVEYLIIGDGNKREELEQLIHELHVEGYVKLLGWYSQKEIIEILNSVHLFVLPSATAERGAQEGIPNALKEAMATGLPVVSTQHAGIPELVDDGVSGFLVPERDLDSLEKALEYLVDHPERWEAMGRAGRQKVEQNFDLKVVNKKFFKILQRLLT